MTKILEAYCDGGAINNPGLAGWAFYILGVAKGYGYVEFATQNEMEITALTKCLSYIGKTTPAKIYCDSTYVVYGITQWIYGWMKKNWMTSSGNPVANRELWEELFKVYSPDIHEIVHVKGHSGVEGNEIADSLVHKAREEKVVSNIIELSKFHDPETYQGVSPDEIVNAVDKVIVDFNNLTDYDKRSIASSIRSKLIIFTEVLSNYE